MKYKKIVCVLMTAALAFTVFAGCGDKEEEKTVSYMEKIPENDPALEVKEEAPVEEAEEETAATEIPEGMYRSELTGLAIDEALKDQRPIAAMVDNEKTALDHYGTAEADIVYEIMNSTANDRVTRLMVIVKDWAQIEQLGSIRSTRPTNIPLAGEYNAVLCHDGGPYYIDDWLARSWAAHFSGGFSRVKNGKDWEFTEYITASDLDDKFASSSYTKEYNQYAPDRDSHFLFVDYGTTLDLSDAYEDVKSATSVDLSAAFKHNSSQLKFNESTGTYDYYEYGSVHKDAEDGEVLTFENVILQNTTFSQLDENGYLIYNMINADDQFRPGYYLTGGEAIPITWLKESETAITKYYDANGDEIQINSGKTYIGLIPSDYWSGITIE